MMTGPAPQLRLALLSREGCETFHQASLEILRRTGLWNSEQVSLAPGRDQLHRGSPRFLRDLVPLGAEFR
jgi:hypothetical protein